MRSYRQFVQFKWVIRRFLLSFKYRMLKSLSVFVCVWECIDLGYILFEMSNCFTKMMVTYNFGGFERIQFCRVKLKMKADKKFKGWWWEREYAAFLDNFLWTLFRCFEKWDVKRKKISVSCEFSIKIWKMGKKLEKFLYTTKIKLYRETCFQLKSIRTKQIIMESHL